MASIYDGIVDVADDAVGSVKRGAGVALREVARVAKEHGVSADAVKSYGDQLVTENPQQATSFADAPGTSAIEGIAGSIPALGAHLAGAAAGARAGRAVGGKYGAVAGGILGGLAPDFVQSYGGNLERQDETGQHDAGTAAIAAVGQAALNQVNPIPAARALRIPGVPASIANIEHPLVDAATHALGFGVAGAATAPAQEALTRAAAGQSLTDAGAIDAYKESAIQGGIAGGVIGGVSRATENALEAQRQRAREVEQGNEALKAKQQAEKQKGKPAKPEPAEVPFSPPDLSELAPAERARLDRAVNPAPMEVDPAKGAISKAVARGANDGAVDGVTVKKPTLPQLPIEEKDIRNPLTIGAPREQKLAEIKALTEQNKPIVDNLLKSIDASLGTTSKSNIKTEESIVNKADRPSILTKKPWHDVDHVRDTFRFKTVANSPADYPVIFDAMQKAGVKIIKADTEKMFQPKEWGWRAPVLDLQMPNGQLVEYYMPMRNMEAAKGAGNHELFEKWRNEDINKLTPDRVSEMAADIATSRQRYDAAHAADLQVAGADETALRASLANFKADSSFLTESNSARSLPVIEKGALSDQAPLDLNARNPSGPNTAVSLPSGEVETRSGFMGAAPLNDRTSVPANRSKVNTRGILGGHEPSLMPARASIPEGADNNDAGAAAFRGAVPATEAGRVRESGRVRGSDGRVEEPGRPVVAPVAGLPRKFSVAGRPIEAGPHEPAHAAAREYARSAGIPYRRPAKYVKVDEARATRVAKAFEDMKHAPNDPQVKAAYAKMIDETQAQWEAIKRSGLKVEFIKPGQPDPYARSPRLMTEDVRQNNHMWVFPTDAGFGGEGSAHVDTSGNPLNVKTGEVIDGKSVVANDIFRIVHDYFGHVKEGYGFRADGEENAYQAHSLMYSDLARRAMATETRGQNSWVNFGPFAEKNRTASGAETEYAPQKIGLLPEWVTNEHVGFEGEAGQNGTATEQALAAAAKAAGDSGARASLGRNERDTGGPRREEEKGQLGPKWARIPRVTEGAPRFVAGKRQSDAVSAIAVHYSNRAGLTSLDPKMAGTGSAGQERRRFGAGQFGKNGGNSARTYFYVQDSRALPERESAVDGSNAYRVQLDNLYDAVNDPRGYREEAGMNADYFEELVRDGGFDGFMAPAPGGGIESPVAITFGFNKKIPVVPARASIGANGAAIPAAQVQSLVDRQTKNWKSGPSIEVVPTRAALPDALLSVIPKGADGAYDGFGKIYLIADRMHSARDVRRVIAHEAYAHYGVNGILGDKFDEFYQRVQNLKDTDEDIRRAYNSVNERYSGLEPHEIADEVVAHLAENYSTLKGRAKIMVAQVIAAVKRFLANNLNIRQDWSVNDVLDMVARSKRAIEQSPDQAVRTAEAARASMEATPFFSAMVRSIVAAKGAPKSAAGGAWKQWLDGAQRRGEFRQGEREWSGIDAWLESKQGNVSRDEIAEFMRNNSVKLEETQLGGKRNNAFDLPDGWQVHRNSDVEDEYGFVVLDEQGRERGSGVTEEDAMENARDDDSGIDGTKYSNYTLPGGENYRELLLQLPSSKIAVKNEDGEFVLRREDGSQAGRYYSEADANRAAKFENAHQPGSYRSSHFDQPNILAHVRMNDRTGPNGEKILHIEEIQSDWHQEGRKKGYALSEAEKKELAALKKMPSNEATATQKERFMALSSREAGDVNHIPDAPFKKEWPMLAFKRALREAVEGSYDKVTWTTGDQQASRYDLSKHIDQLTLRSRGEDKWRLTAYKDGSRVMQEEDVPTAKLSDYIGKEAAEKLIAKEPDSFGERELSGQSLSVGGEGMKAFYDKMLPSEVSKYVKQWGGKVGKTELPTSMRLNSRGSMSVADGDLHSVDITPAMRDSVRKGQPMFSVPKDATNARASVPAQAESFDGWTRPSERLSDYITNGAKERIDAYRKAGSQKADQIRGLFQDYFTPVKRVQEAIAQRGGKIDEDSDVYGREELYYGRTGERLRKLEDEQVKPLLEQMAKNGTNLDDLELYLYAKFAPERNARIAAINDRLPDGGSGMTNADAEKVLKDFESNGQSKKLEALADRVYKMNEVRVAALEDAGLIGKEEAKAWREDKHYVPLKGFAEGVNDDKVQRPPIGSGFSVGGKEAWRALGRRSRATDILANIVSQTDQAIIRAEKNRVAQSLLKLVQDNPNERLWTVDKTVNKPGFDRATGEVKYSNRPEPDAIIAKIDGEEHRININDPQLRDSIKNMGAAKVGAILRGFSSINRFLSLTRTTLAPEFALANMSRDLQEATINLTGKVGPGAAARAVADVPSAIKAMWGQLGGKKVGGEWARWAQEFADAGGMTSFVAQRTVEEAQSRLEGLLKQANGGVVGNSRKLITGVGDFIEQANNTIENATRLSAYVQGRRAGMSSQQAARLAKNLTVNFNRKGSAGAAINALWLFYNASIQGSARFLHAIKSPRVQAMMGGIAATGFALSYYNRMVAGKDSDGEDLWDKIPEYEKQRNLIIMNAFGDGTHLKIPMPYTYNLPYLLGAEMADMVHGKKKPSTAAANMVNSLVGSFNPIGDYDIKKDPTEQSVKLFSPTALQPFLDLAFNRNHFDSPITPEESQFAKVKAPDSQRFFPSTNPGAVWMADQLNTLTGGNKVRPGAIDISPASMTYLFDYLTGGTGSFFDRAGTAAALALRGEPVPIGKVPFARVFAGALDDRRINDTFYTARDDVNAKAELAKLIAKPGGFAGASPSDHKDARFGIALAASLRDIERKIKPVNDAIKLARAKGDDARLKTLQNAQRALMLQFNRAYFRVKEQMQD